MANASTTVAQKQKDSYSLSEVSELVGVNSWTIRYWTCRFDYIKPHQDKTGEPRFVSEDIEIIKQIYHLTKSKGIKRNDVEKHLIAKCRCTGFTCKHREQADNETKK